MSAFVHEYTTDLVTSPERAFAMISDANELQRWFAEFVEVEPRTGGAYRFWGRHTYGVPERSQATQQITHFAPPDWLSFRWNIHGQPSEVTYWVATDPKRGEGVAVRVQHRFEQQPDIARARELIEDLWRLHLGNLQAYASGRNVMLVEFGEASPEIRLSILIDAPRDAVFRALLQPELLNRWISAAAVVEPHVGGRYSYGWSYDYAGVRVEGGPTRILQLVENEKLVTDWPDWRGDASMPTQRITWLVESVGDQTRVTMIHSGFTRTADFSDYPFGWGHFLERLKLSLGGQMLPTLEVCA